jgi:mRNA interferase MazF
VRLNFTPQAGLRQALILSPQIYNRRSGVALVCQVAPQVKGYPCETPLPPESDVSGVILADHLRSVDRRVRGATRHGRAPSEVLAKARTLL